MNPKWLPLSEAAKLANVSSLQHLHKLIRKDQLPAYYELRGKLKFWYVDIASERFKDLLKRVEKCAANKAKAPDIDWDEWTALCQTGESIVKRPCTARTTGNYRYVIERFFKTYPVLNRDTLRAALNEYVKRETRDRDYYHSKAQVFAGLMTVARYYVFKGLHAPSFIDSLLPLKPVRKVKGERNVRWHEVDAIINAAEGVDTAKTQRKNAVFSDYNRHLNKTLLYFAIYTASRSSEMAEVRLSDIDWKENSITIHGKGGKKRVVGIAPKLRNALRRWKVVRSREAKTDHLFVSDKGRPLHRDYIHRRIKRVGKWAGLTLSPHDIRRSSLTWMLTDQNIDVGTVRDIAGHSSLEITNRYTKPSRKRVIEAMRNLK